MRTYRTYIILFTCITSIIQKKKTNHLYNPFSYHIHIHRYFWLCEYIYTIHKTTYNITTTKEITNTKFLSTWQKIRL